LIEQLRHSKTVDRERISALWRLPVIPVLILVVVFFSAAFADFIAPHSPTLGSLSARLLPPAWMEGGRMAYVLGTDSLGRDILSRLIYGARISLTVALLAIFAAGALGSLIGLLAGYFGGRLDAVLMRLTDIGLSMPLMLMAIVLTGVLGASLANIIVVISLLLWPYYARQIRGETLSVVTQDFIAKARVAGCSDFRVMWRHILPNLVPSLLVLATMQAASVIILEASLSFLGVGVPPSTPSWGLMVSEGRATIGSEGWIAFWPGLIIFLTVFAANFLGDWIRDELDPRERTS
jgi:peptide/nickel transport system permease protein